MASKDGVETRRLRQRYMPLSQDVSDLAYDLETKSFRSLSASMVLEGHIVVSKDYRRCMQLYESSTADNFILTGCPGSGKRTLMRYLT